MTPRRVRVPMLAAVVAGMMACGDRAALSDKVMVDTLPGGIVRTMSSAPTDSGRWSLVPVREVAPPEGQVGEHLNPFTVAIADDGSVLTFEPSPAQVRVYDAEGRLVRTLGSAGRGPGEFAAESYLAIRGDTVAVNDPLGYRLSTWNWRTGALLAERGSACCYWESFGIDGNGRAWVRRQPTAADTAYAVRPFLRLALAGTATDTILAYERAGLSRPPQWIVSDNRLRVRIDVPLQPHAVFAVDPTAGLITGWTGDYTLRTTRDGTDTVALFGRSHTRTPMTSAEKTRVIEAQVQRMLAGGSPFSEATLRQGLDPDLLPGLRPAWETIAVDRTGRRWVRLSLPDTSSITFDLFDAEGRWLDVVRAPRSAWPPESGSTSWGRDHVAIIAEGEDGRPLIRVFAIRRR